MRNLNPLARGARILCCRPRNGGSQPWNPDMIQAVIIIAGLVLVAGWDSAAK